jgi:alanine racemase
MGRLGIYWEEAPDVIEQIHGLRGLHIEGLASHFACADSDDKHMAKQQIARFRHVIQECEKRELHCGVKHISNSGGILSSFEWDMDAVRPGILLYGYGCGRRQIARTLETRPILQWKSRIVQLRKVRKGFRISYESTYTVPQDTTVGIVDAGYADGYPRLLSNKAPVIVHGKRVPVIGRVTMNLMVVDLGPDTVAEEGDEVVLLGEQGDASVWADELAEYCNTIPYEILTGIRTDCRVVVE